MRPTRPVFANLVNRTLTFGALAGLAVLTLVDRGATRMYATPWTAIFWFIQITPIVALLFRALSSRDRLWLPGRPWKIALMLFSIAVIASAASSPYRGVSVLAACMPLAGVAAFLLVHDWLAHDLASHSRRLLLVAGLASAAISLTCIGQWFVYDLNQIHSLHEFAARLQGRNAHPLGHSNYTAGLALLAFPWPALLALSKRGRARAGWAAIALLPLVMLFTSASRGGFIGIAAMGIAALWQARLSRRELLLAFIAIIAAGVALAYAHPRTRALVFQTSFATAPNLSNVQRTAMAKGGLLMTRARPLLGWGPGSTPLAFPKFRAQLDGGVEDAYQLHSTPVQLLADLGIIGFGTAAILLLLAAMAAVGVRRSKVGELPLPARSAAALALAGYGAFALTDYQLDVPVFTFSIAVLAALLAKPLKVPASPRQRRVLTAAGLLALGAIALLGRPDPTPEMNVRALTLAAKPGQSAQLDEAITLLRESLKKNPDQEIAHFNLGWLLVVRDPRAAEAHFNTAAHLVPDKGGVYFGLALARLNQGQPDQTGGVVRALALECLNDPAFLISPWWRQPALATLRGATIAELRTIASTVALRLAARNDLRSRDADYLPALAEWLDGHGDLGEILGRSKTSTRVTYFAARPEIPAWTTAAVKTYHRERTGYPILMRNLDLPPPIDLYEVRENSLASGELAPLFPAKGWLPAPYLIELLDGPATLK